MITCNVCNINKEEDKFRRYLDKNGNVKRYAKICKACDYERSKEHRNEICKEYYAKNNKIIKKQRKKFRKENPDNQKEQLLKLLEKRPTFKIIRTIGRRIRKSIEDIEKWRSIIDFNEETLKELLEYNFLIDWDLGMTLENHGTVWEIDHVKPISSFDLTKKNEQKLAFSWKNTVPRLCSDNKKKSNKIMHNEIKEINKRVRIFEVMKLLKCQKQPVNTINK